MKRISLCSSWPVRRAPLLLSMAVIHLHAAPFAGPLPRLDGIFYETARGRTPLPSDCLAQLRGSTFLQFRTNLPDGRLLKVSLDSDGTNYTLRLDAVPNFDIRQWGLSVAAGADEYFTGLMERVVDWPQQDSWAPGITNALNLRGQTVDMILKPTMSVYAPFYLSSAGYAAFVQSDWPGRFDFCKSDPRAVKIRFEGPSLTVKFYTGRTPAQLVRAHALDAGPPFLPPRWMYATWRWRDEIRNRPAYYDGTSVTGPFNSQFMEDVLLMKAYGIPLGVYWIDRPWGPGPNGYDDFQIDPRRLPRFAESVRWLNAQGIQMFLWIGPFFQGKMEQEALSRGYNLPGQRPMKNNYPLCDFTNPDAKKFWQDGVAKLLKLGVAGFKLDRGEEGIPDGGPYRVFDGRSLRENRDLYPVEYLKAAYDVTMDYRPDHDFVLMPRAAYTGSARYGVFWGGDIGGVQNGLRAEILAVQRAAVMGYPNWGSDTGGYNQQSMDTEVVGRWLEFSCFTPIMEVGPTDNRAFWDYHHPPRYDAKLIALWRLYARLHARLADYSFEQAKVAHQTGTPIVRPLFLADPQAPAAWSNWWTYLYGPDILVSPVWKKNQRAQEVYLPSGAKWQDAWTKKIYAGGRTITVSAPLHQMPIFVRVGSKIDLGDLNREWKDAVAAAHTRPDLKALDAEVRAWFNRHYSKRSAFGVIKSVAKTNENR
ncbi:MAG: glycoside hydrolase family 31 protein [Verrucomicrobiota bacterium]|nr:glycoside hydrolase family 31 protein [Verrucomicrobiota bacterium]